MSGAMSALALVLSTPSLLPHAPLLSTPSLLPHATLRPRVAHHASSFAAPLHPLPIATSSLTRRADSARSRHAAVHCAQPAEPATDRSEPDAGSLLKWAVLALLVVQNALTSVLTSASRAPRADGGVLYLSGAAVLMTELLKLPTCLALIARDEGGPRAMARAVWQQVFVNWRDTLTMAVPALCYCLQNLLFYVALSHMTAPAYQLWSQTKTLFTAFFFVSYLGGDLKPNQWLSMLMLSVGVGWAQCTPPRPLPAAQRRACAPPDLAFSHASPTPTPPSLLPLSRPRADSGAAASAQLLGVAAVLLSSLLSGFANVYLEKRVKRTTVSIWMRNVQLGLFGIPQSASLLLAPATKAAVASHGLFVGFDPLVWSVVALKAIGGLLVAAVVKVRSSSVPRAQCARSSAHPPHFVHRTTMSWRRWPLVVEPTRRSTAPDSAPPPLLHAARAVRRQHSQDLRHRHLDPDHVPALAGGRHRALRPGHGARRRLAAHVQ